MMCHRNDSHGIEESNAAPVTDTSQDVHVLEGFQNETHTSITFIRNWQTCDPQDHRLTGDTVRVLWALHQSDPELNTAIWHGDKRGGRALRLRTPSPHAPPQEMQDIRHWDVKLNQFTVSDTMDTVYWCKIFKAPSLTKKHHMIGYTPLVEKANEDLVHHVIVYECASTSPILGQHARIAGAPCYSPTMPREWESCLQPVLAWARGSRGEWLPDHVGIPIAEHQEGSYYMLEVHYNNPGLKKVIDSSGVRIHLTPKLRAQEAGILVAGVAVSPLHLVPPRQKEYATAGYCTPHCTNTMFPEDGVNVVSVVLHSHLAGRRLSLKHIRKGKELPRIVQDNHFDFDYQQSHTLEKEVKILPGDELVAECVYRTLDRTRPTLGGYAASQEMCLAFVVHYPRTPLAACYSMTPVKDLFKTLAVYSFKGVTMDHLEKLFLTTGADPVSLPSTARQQLPVYPATRPSEQIDEDIIREAESALKAMRDYSEERENDNVFARLIIEEPEEFRGRTLAEHILALPWTEELLARSIEKSLYHGRHMTFCRKRDDKLALPANIQTFPNFTALPEQNETVCSELRISSSDSSNISLNFFITLITVIKILFKKKRKKKRVLKGQFDVKAPTHREISSSLEYRQNVDNERICLYKRRTLGTSSISSSPELRGRTSSEFQHFLLQRDENEDLRNHQISNQYRMRRTRHVVLPVRSWQYIGLLLVSLACVTFGLVARDREGQAGSLTGPELLHRAPHNVDVCPNLNPLATSSMCLGLSEKQNLALKNNERKEIGSDIVRVERKKSTESCINRNTLLERRHRTMNERSFYPTKRLSRSLERVDSRIENVRLSYRYSPNSEMTRDVTDRTRKLSRRLSNDRSRSMERREERGIKRTDGQRTLDNRELKERRERFEIDTRRKFNSRAIEKREIRGHLRENIESRTIRENQKSIRERTQDRRSNSVERQEFRRENMERRLIKERYANDRRNSRIDSLDRRSNVDAERRNSRMDNLNRERRSSVSTERRNSRINTLNRERRLSVNEERKNSRVDTLNRERRLDISAERRNSRLDTVNIQRGSNLNTERRNSRLDTFNRERRLSVSEERRNSRANTLNRERRLDVSAERRNSRLDIINRQRGSSLTTERKNSRLDTFNRERRSNMNAERRNSRSDTLNRERRLDVNAERRNSRLSTVNTERGSNLSVERRNSRLDTFNRERRLDVNAERRNSRLDTVNSQRESIIDAERRNSRVDTLNRERRLGVSAERRISRLDTVNKQRRSSLTTERRNSRLNAFIRERRSNVEAERRNSRANTLNRERRLDVSAERRNSRLDTVNRQRESSLAIERRNSRLEIFNRERRSSVDAERKNSRLDISNRERQSNVDTERRNSRLDTLNRERRSLSMTDRTRTRKIQENRYDRESILSNSLKIRKSTSRDNTPADRKNFRSEIRNIRFNSLERQQSGNRLENSRFERRMIDNEDRKLHDRRTRSVDRRNTNTLNRNNRHLDLERRISIDRASEYIDRRDNRRELVNRLSRSPFSDRNSRREIDRTKVDRSSESRDNNEQRNVLLNRRIMETPKLNRREVNTLRRTIRSSNIENLRNSLRYSLDRSLDRTNRIERFSNKRSNEKLTERRSTLGEIADEISFVERRRTQYGQRRISRTLTPEISDRRSFVAREYQVSKQGKRLSRSFDNLNRLNSNERRESVESRRFGTDNDRRSSVLSTDRRDTRRQRENLARTSVLLRTTNLQERRRFNTRIQERYNRKIERTIDERRKSNDPSLAGKIERSMELRSRDQRRNVRSNLIVTRHNDSQTRYIDALNREENVDFDIGFKLIERSRNNVNKRSSYRRSVDLRQSNSLREKSRTSETSTYHRNTIFVPMIDRDRLDLIREGAKTRRLFNTNRRTLIMSQEFRNNEYGRKTRMIANLLKTNVLSNYDSSFEIIRQTFIIIICILYGSSMSKNNKLFTGNLMESIRKFALW
ncbi:MOXD1 1 [Vespula maculifrons]|uniref:MOXD1 1 n=1 Tax=Vespula maculifrons TaxID=7453 RepID=A0ABD2CCM6_VESMC